MLHRPRAHPRPRPRPGRLHGRRHAPPRRRRARRWPRNARRRHRLLPGRGRGHDLRRRRGQWGLRTATRSPTTSTRTATTTASPIRWRRAMRTRRRRRGTRTVTASPITSTRRRRARPWTPDPSTRGRRRRAASTRRTGATRDRSSRRCALPSDMVPTGCTGEVDRRDGRACATARQRLRRTGRRGAATATPGACSAASAARPAAATSAPAQDGMQTVHGGGRVRWDLGRLRGRHRGRAAEVCDALDNDCNGCTDEVEGCVPDGSCPGPTDPRVPDGRPFSSYPLHGSDFYSASDAVSWHWTCRGTPCDHMFQAIPGSTATSESGSSATRCTAPTARTRRSTSP